MVATHHITAAELAERPGDERVELIEGELVETSPASGGHGVIIRRLAAALFRYIDAHPGPALWLGETGFLLGRRPDTVLAPDLAVSLDDATTVDERQFVQTPPALVIEVRSPSEREAMIARKTGFYLQAGVQEVWWARPDERQIRIHRDDRAPQIVPSDGTLECPEILPGFRLPLAGLFG
jgi:Uma2 family endonuclease